MECPNQTKDLLRAGQGGSASIISLITVIAAFLMATTYLYLAQAEQRSTTRNIQARQALYLAEAGLELARSKLAQDPAWAPESVYSLGNGSFTVAITPNSTGYTVRASGRMVQAVHNLEIDIVPAGNGTWKISSYKEVYP